MAGRKQAHLNEAIRQKLSQLLVKEASDPRFHSVTITGVTVAKDLSTANVRFSAYDPTVDAQEIATSLNNAAGFFGQALGRTLKTRRTPRLTFYYDPGYDYAQEMDDVFKRIAPSDE